MQGVQKVLCTADQLTRLSYSGNVTVYMIDTPCIADIAIVDEQLLVLSFSDHEPGGIQGRDHLRLLI